MSYVRDVLDLSDLLVNRRPGDSPGSRRWVIRVVAPHPRDIKPSSRVVVCGEAEARLRARVLAGFLGREVVVEPA